MPQFITDPIVDAYVEWLNSSTLKFSDIPDIDEVLSDSYLASKQRSILNECQSDIDSTCRYLSELVIPDIAEKIKGLPSEISPSVKKHLSKSIISLLEKI